MVNHATSSSSRKAANYLSVLYDGTNNGKVWKSNPPVRAYDQSYLVNNGKTDWMLSLYVFIVCLRAFYILYSYILLNFIDHGPSMTTILVHSCDPSPVSSATFVEQVHELWLLKHCEGTTSCTFADLEPAVSTTFGRNAPWKTLGQKHPTPWVLPAKAWLCPETCQHTWGYAPQCHQNLDSTKVWLQGPDQNLLNSETSSLLWKHSIHEKKMKQN